TRVTTVAGSRGGEHKVTQEIALDPGDNRVEVVAYNAGNLLASPPARLTIKFMGPADAVKPRLHILAIGINKYADEGWAPPGKSEPLAFGPLRLAVKDASTLGADLQRAAASLYKEVRVTYALDEQASKAGLEKTIDRLSKEIHPRDTFIFFAAG